MMSMMKTAALSSLCERESDSGASEIFLDVKMLSRLFKRDWLYTNGKNPLNSCGVAQSGSFYALLYKNLSVTDASLSEIISLLRLHTKRIDDSSASEIDFFDDEEFTRFIENLWAPQSRMPFVDHDTARHFIDNRIAKISNYYFDLIANIIVLDVYYTSVIFHVPPSMICDIRTACFESGYIQSIGYAVYMRNIEKARYEILHESLRKALSNLPYRKIYVVPYAEEFFSPYDRNTAVSIRNGLDGVRIQLSKMHISGIPLINILSSLPEIIKEPELYVPLGLSHPNIERQRGAEDGCDERCTLWFLTDSDVDYSKERGFARRGRKRYIIAYLQIYLNDSELLVLKERKPGWYAPITLPHTLSAATVNVLRRYAKSIEAVWWRDRSKPLSVLDPFCGTGTGLIDYALRDPSAVLLGVDREPLVPQVIRDNFDFLTRDKSDLLLLHANLERMRDLLQQGISAFRGRKSHPLMRIDEIRRNRKHLVSSYANNVHLDNPKLLYETAMAMLLDELHSDDDPGKRIAELIADKQASGFTHRFASLSGSESTTSDVRLLLYLLWRAVSNGKFALRQSVETVENDLHLVVLSEIEKVASELEHLGRGYQSPLKGEFGGFSEASGTYSRRGILSAKRLKNILSNTFYYSESLFKDKIAGGGDLQPGIHIVSAKDSLDLIDDLNLKVDVIFTDPPYGFNTSEGGHDELEGVFYSMIPVLLKALNLQGQLSFVLPAFAHNGRRIPFFETKDLLVRRIIREANKLGMWNINLVETFPSYSGAKRLFRFPTTWNSRSVLERRILHFILQK